VPSYLKTFFIILASLLVLILVTVAGFSFWYLSQFNRVAGTNFVDLKCLSDEIKTVFPDSFNFLVLGLDNRDGSDTLLTDTIMAGFYHLNSEVGLPVQAGKLIFLSLPRDLWIGSLKTKINALYYYDGTSLVKEEVEKIVGEEISYSIILDLASVSEIVDLVGGIEIDVDQVFDDYDYPKDDGSGETVHIRFNKGKQTMTGERVLQYIRSRKSSDITEGTDKARARRQQKVVLAILKRISQFRLIANPKTTGRLYRFWQERINTDLPLALLLKLGGVYAQGKINFEFFSLPDEFLFVPSIRKHGLWVLEPKGGGWGQIREWVKEMINGK